MNYKNKMSWITFLKKWCISLKSFDKYKKYEKFMYYLIRNG